eukprot:scaffold8862_cov122-Isochrysis_galbana.AAC.2
MCSTDASIGGSHMYTLIGPQFIHRVIEHVDEISHHHSTTAPITTTTNLCMQREYVGSISTALLVRGGWTASRRAFAFACARAPLMSRHAFRASASISGHVLWPLLGFGFGVWLSLWASGRLLAACCLSYWPLIISHLASSSRCDR